MLIGRIAVLVDATEPSLLAAQVLKYQREVHGLSLADVAKMLGSSSRNAYASYEQGRTEPTLGKFRELLMAVAPDMALIVGPRIGPRAARPTKKQKVAGLAPTICSWPMNSVGKESSPPKSS